MKLKAIALAAALILWLIPAAPAEAPAFPDDPAAIENALSSVVMLEIYNAEDERITRGSGFAAFGSGILVTCSHILVNMDHMIAVTEDGRRLRVDRILDMDTEADVALCALPEDAGLVPLPFAADPLPLRGEQITAAGSALGILNMVSLGNISARWSDGILTWLTFTAPISPGFSGGPLFDSAGNVVGVIAGTYEGTGSVSLAAPIGAAWRLWQAQEQ